MHGGHDVLYGLVAAIALLATLILYGMRALG